MWPELHCRTSFSGKLRQTVHARCGSDSSVGMAAGCAAGEATTGAAAGVAAAAGEAAAGEAAADEAAAGEAAAEELPAPFEEVRCFLDFFGLSLV